MKMRQLVLFVVILLLVTALPACSNKGHEMNNGYYSAEMASFDEHGWKEYITIYVSGNKIITVEYDAHNASGFVKSWDLDYMTVMNAHSGTYPNEYTRYYTESLLKCQNPDEVDVLTGATASHVTFQMLVHAAITQAKDGNKQVAQVEVMEGSEHE